PGTFGPAGGSVTVTPVPGEGTLGFLAKYDPDGNLVWVQLMHGYVNPTRVNATPDGHLLVTGYIWASSTFGTGPSATTSPAQGNDDGFVAIYASDGSLTHAFVVGSPGYDGITGSTVDASGVTITGFHSTPLTVGEGLTAITLSTGSAFVAHYDTTYALKW